MQLEEAKEQLESLKEDIKSNIDDLTDIEDVFVQDVLAIETVIQEIETLQKSNAELQKENEELKKENGKLTRARKWFIEHTVGQIATPEMLRKILADEYIHKDKIREKIEELKHADSLKVELCHQHDNKAMAQIEVLEELLKEE